MGNREQNNLISRNKSCQHGHSTVQALHSRTCHPLIRSLGICRNFCCVLWLFGFLLTNLRASEQSIFRSLIVDVTDETEQPVAGAIVTVHPKGSLTAFSCTTDEGGTCKIERLPSGTWEMDVRGPFHDVAERTLEGEGRYAEGEKSAGHGSDPIGRKNVRISITLSSRVARARQALSELKPGASRLVEQSKFQEALHAVAGAISAFERVSSVDQRPFVLQDGVDVLTLAGALWEHLGGDLHQAASFLSRAHSLSGQLYKQNVTDLKLPDDLARAEIMLAIKQGQSEQACACLQDAVAERKWLKPNPDTPSFESEGDTQWWTENRRREEFRDLAISIALSAPKPVSRCAELALQLTLLTKGQVLDATTRKIAWLRTGLPPRYQHYVSELQAVWDEKSLDFIKAARSGEGRRELDEFLKAPPWDRQRGPQTDYERKQDSLRQRESELLKLLIRARKQVRVQVDAVTDRVRAVHSRLPSDAALVQFCRYRPYSGHSAQGPDDTIFDADRYAAFLVLSDTEMLIDLGEANGIDQLSENLLASILYDEKSNRSVIAGVTLPLKGDFHNVSVDLFNRVLAPLLPSFRGTYHLILAPDRGLSLVPFAALQTEDGRYAIDRFLITYVNSGADLLQNNDVARSGPSLLIGGPDFGHAKDPADDEWDARGTARTQSEVWAVRKKIGEGLVLTGGAATKEAVQLALGPRILHLATHATAHGGVATAAMSVDTRRYLVAEILGINRELQRDPERPEEHLLLPRVALAGANANSDRGTLNGAEIARLDLHGTQMAVLSACQTSLGEIRDEEGVYSLRRALTIAGSQTQVTTLWSVDDAAMEKLIAVFYGYLEKGRGEALRIAQLQFLRGSDVHLRNPFFWAGVQLSGDSSFVTSALRADRNVRGTPKSLSAHSTPGKDARRIVKQPDR